MTDKHRVWQAVVEAHLQDDGADQGVDRPGEGFSHPGSLKTPQHYSPFAEDGEEIQHLATSYLHQKKKHKPREKSQMETPRLVNRPKNL